MNVEVTDALETGRSGRLSEEIGGENPCPQGRQPASAGTFPFTAIVGQDELKLALLLNAVDPLIGGVIAMGHRGTGKSTTVRALARLLPPLRVVAGCRFHCDPDRPGEWCTDCAARAQDDPDLPVTTIPTPLVELPLGTTEDRLLGSLDLEQALRQGTKAFEPGLLAAAHRGFLYIDEVNLLDDALVDRLLDVAASGVNVVERESISLRHPARFVLIGSGNPEEGELRPQLLDRFGLFVAVTTPTDIDVRVEIIRRREAYERDREAFIRRFAAAERQVTAGIVSARRRLAAVHMPDAALRWIASLCAQLALDGHRGELACMRAAKALAAWEGRTAVEPRDVVRVAPMALRHRLRRDPLETHGDERAIAERIAAEPPAW